METITSKENKIKYKLFGDGTAYHIETPELLCAVLQSVRSCRQRVKITLGDTKTGREWGDIETGYIGRSTGNIKVPLIIHNARSIGGGALLDHCILKVEHANKKDRIKYGPLYQLIIK